METYIFLDGAEKKIGWSSYVVHVKTEMEPLSAEDAS